jgi:tRNA(adenine34) deaminase
MGQKRDNGADEAFCRQALMIALQSLNAGNLPFGCLLVGPGGEVLLEGENTVITSGDRINHCEINLAHSLAGKFEFEFLHNCIVYASTEPCPMCTAALFWSGIGELVYAVSKEGYKKASGDDNPVYNFPVSSKELLQRAGRNVTVAGPVLEEEGIEFYQSLRNRL